MITPERQEFLEKAQSYLLDIMKYTVKPDWDLMEETIILLWLYKLEDWDKLSECELNYVQKVIKCLEKRICIPNTTTTQEEYILLEDDSRITMEGVLNGMRLTCNC